MRVGLALYGSLAEQSGVPLRPEAGRGPPPGRRHRGGRRTPVANVPARAARQRASRLRGPPPRRRRRDAPRRARAPSLLLANRDLPYPIVSIVHHLRASEPPRLSPLYRAVERRYLATVDGVVCNSAATRDAVAALGVARDSTVVAPPAGDRFDPAIDDAEIASRARNRPLGAIFVVGNIEPRKGSTRSSRRWLWRTPTSSSPSWAGPSTRNTSPRSGGWSASAGSTSACVLPADCRTPSWPRPSVRATSSRSPPGTRGSGSSTWRG